MIALPLKHCIQHVNLNNITKLRNRRLTLQPASLTSFYTQLFLFTWDPSSGLTTLHTAKWPFHRPTWISMGFSGFLHRTNMLAKKKEKPTTTTTKTKNNTTTDTHTHTQSHNYQLFKFKESREMTFISFISVPGSQEAICVIDIKINKKSQKDMQK